MAMSTKQSHIAYFTLPNRWKFCHQCFSPLDHFLSVSQIIFYHDHTCDFDVDDQFAKLWRSVAVDGVDDDKIADYLSKQGITSMRDQGPKRPAVPIRKGRGGKGGGKKRKVVPKDNDHLRDVLEDYNEMTAEHRSVVAKPK